ncbi:MAG: dctQ [Hyphomicrobiales bacterium]|nr:dctQ [Hyphomicrobiales bacterium]
MSSHGFELPGVAPAPVAASHPVVAGAQAGLAFINKVILIGSSLALIAASLILSYSVLVRYYFKAATYWQDEASVFLLVGATFLTAAYVQSKRGHVAIDAVAGLLPAGVNRIRMFVVDVVSLLFCAFFSWKSWTLFHEAWEDGQVTSSTWAPPLWIPYSIMAAGMTQLCVQILLQIIVAIDGEHRR